MLMMNEVRDMNEKEGDREEEKIKNNHWFEKVEIVVYKEASSWESSPQRQFLERICLSRSFLLERGRNDGDSCKSHDISL